MDDEPHHLHAALTELPGIIGELRGQLEPGRSEDTGRGKPGVNPNAPLRLNPVDDADDLYASLREHAACIADALRAIPPTTIGRTINGEKGLPANTPPETAYTQALTLTRYIDHQLPMIRDDDLIDDIATDIIRRWRSMSNKYPSRAPKQLVPIRCINCEVMLVYMRPPRSFGSDETFVCDSCGRWHTEQEVAEQRVKQRAELKAKGATP